MISTRKQRAAVLLFVLATLALMAALAVAFARHSMTERRASRGYADKVRAQMLAEAGIQHALGHLSAVADKQWDSLLDSWVCLDPPDATLEALRHPSLRRGIAHELAYSGLLGSDIEPPQPNHLHPRRGTYAVNGDQYTLRVVDLSSRIDLRHPDTDGEGNLRLLNNLCQLIGLDVLAGDSLAARPGSNGFSSLDEILALFDEQTAEKLAPYLTVHAWRDRTAVRPGVRRKAGDASLTSEPHGRAPLNLNLAPAVLVQAVLTDIAATFLETSTRRTRSVRIRPNVAKTLTDLVVARRRKRPFQSHADFESFIAGLVGRPLTLNQAALIAVHANPDARLLKFNPDRALFGSTKLPRPFDRSDLTRFTTEFTFRRTGAFRVESLGRVIAPTGIVVARAEISTVVRVHSQQRVTSQHAHLTTAQEREGVTLYPESYGAAKRTSSLTGRIGLDSPPVSGLAFFQKGSLKPVVGSLPQPEGSAATGSVFIGGNRFADGYHAQREQKRTLSYKGDKLPTAAGSLSFWWKPDWDGFRRTGALFYADSPTGPRRGISTAIYYQQGMLYATRTHYMDYKGTPGDFHYESKTPVIVNGKVRPDAFQRLFEYGYRWLATRKPGHSYWHYKVYGDEFARRVLNGISTGKQSDVLYIYDVEARYGMGHVGCITQYIYLRDFYPYVYQTGFKTHREEVNTLAYLDVVDESGNPRFTWATLSAPHAASRVEKGIAIAGLKPHEWYHVSLTWEDGTNIRLFLDGVESRDHTRYFGPMNPWSSRLTGPLGKFSIGPFTLDRASGEAGAMTPALSGKSLFIGTHATFSDLSIGNTAELRKPTPRYRDTGHYVGRISVQSGSQLIGVSMATTTPARTKIALALKNESTWHPARHRESHWPESLRLAGATLDYRLTLSATHGSPGKLSPFVDSLTFTWLHRPVILARHVR